MEYTGADGKAIHMQTADLEAKADTNTYCYRYDKDNQSTRLKGIVLGNWESQRFDVAKLSCYRAKGEKTMPNKTGEKREMPPKEELAQVFKDCDYKIDRARAHYRTGWGTAKQWLIDAGLIDKFNKPLMEKTENPKQPELPKEDNLTQGQVLEKELPEVTADNDDNIDQPEDAVEIKEIGFDVEAFKLDLIRIVLRETGLRKAPAKVGLDIVGAIQSA